MGQTVAQVFRVKGERLAIDQLRSKKKKIKNEDQTLLTKGSI